MVSLLRFSPLHFAYFSFLPMHATHSTYLMFSF
jgi:hypothetical protein